ncbi:MAG: hypothetical protein JRM99_08780 [Nitrososphaerota archaeon]|nr:hypothetical protein [Nitrososphaerota archaeon]MDG6991490.1 hypothetical protein [Nitrososphaerota archaeon]
MYAQVLIAASFAAAAYQDVRERAVSDLVWIPAVAGVAYVLYSFYTGAVPDLWFYLAKLALIGGVALGFTFFGYVGQADGIAIALVAADPYMLSPLLPLMATAVVALGHIGYELGVGNARGTKTVPMAQFLREQRWIPKAIVSSDKRTEVSADVNVAREEVVAANLPDASVEVKYGVPTVAYLGVGYAAYVVYLLAFSHAAFASLP